MNKNPEIQFRSPEEIKAYQESRLAEELLYLQNHSRFYQHLFQAYHIDIQQINRTLATNTCHDQDRPATS